MPRSVIRDPCLGIGYGSRIKIILHTQNTTKLYFCSTKHLARKLGQKNCQINRLFGPNQNQNWFGPIEGQDRELNHLSIRLVQNKHPFVVLIKSTDQKSVIKRLVQ